MEKFDYLKFKELMLSGDINGLEYLEKTIIKEMKEKNKNKMKLTREDYIIGLFNATNSLNWCNAIYEEGKVENKFNWEYYTIIRDLLLEELGLLSLFD